MSLMEVLFRVWKDEGEKEGVLAYQQCLALPVSWIHENKALLENAGELKACYPLSLADVSIAAAALLEDAVLFHKVPKFSALSCRQLVLPYK